MIYSTESCAKSCCLQQGRNVREEIAVASYGKTAVVEYVGKLEDGTVFDSTEGMDPLEFVIGSGAVINGFDGEELIRIANVDASEVFAYASSDGSFVSVYRPDSDQAEFYRF